MLKIGNIDWFAILRKEAATIEEQTRVKIDISKPICQEVGRLIGDNLTAIGLQQPNVAKIAGQVAFWVRKLKPLSLSRDTPNFLLTLNELAGLRIGIFRDWVNSFRYHSHSPHSSMISFELLMCDN